VLELLLEKAAGTAIIKHMFSLILNGEIERSGPKTVNEKSKAAKNISKAVYDRLRQILPGFRPINKDSICVGRLIVDAAAELSVQLRKHFRDCHSPLEPGYVSIYVVLYDPFSLHYFQILTNSSCSTLK